MSKNYVKIRKVPRLPGESPDPVLKWLDVELTHRCNNRCIHCGVNQPPEASTAERELNTAEWKNYIRDASALGCRTIRITGGEPLLREDFKDICRFAREIGMTVVLFTNATLIDEGIASLLAEYLPGIMVEITLYGMSARSYETVTGVPGSFRRAMRGIRLLQEREIPHILKSAYLPPNHSELEEFIRFSKSVKWQQTMPQVSMMFNCRTRRDSESKNRRIKALRPDPATIVGFMKRSGTEYRREMLTWISRQKVQAGDLLFQCGAGHKYASVDPYGTLKPCLSLYHPDALYDLKKGSLRDAMARFFPEMRQKRAQNRDYLEKCARCFIKPLCEQCPVKSWTEYGELDQPVDYYCRIAHRQARSLGILADHEYGWEIPDGGKRILHLMSTLEKHRH